MLIGMHGKVCVPSAPETLPYLVADLIKLHIIKGKYIM